MPLPSFLQRFRRSGPDHAAPELSATPAMDVEAARTRARRQLIGMLVLVVAGVLGFPWLFETQPRPLSQDVQVVQAGSDGMVDASGAGRAPIAGRVGVAAIEAPAAPVEAAATKPPAAQDIVETEETAPVARAASASASAAAPKPDAKALMKDLPKPAVKPVAAVAEAEHKAAERAAEKKMAEKKAADKLAADKKAAEKAAAEKAAADKKLAEARKADAKRAEAASTKDTAKDAAKDSAKEPVRYVVQFGAFADNAAAQAARAKVEKLGIKTYAQTVDTPAGKRTRVRVGPYATKAEADKANAAIQKAGMSGSVLTL